MYYSFSDPFGVRQLAAAFEFRVSSSQFPVIFKNWELETGNWEL
jgi:hypothetical protein